MCHLQAYIYDSCCHRGPRGDCKQLSKCEESGGACVAETDPTDIAEVASREGFCPACREKRAQGLPAFKYRTRKISGYWVPYDWSTEDAPLLAPNTDLRKVDDIYLGFKPCGDQVDMAIGADVAESVEYHQYHPAAAATSRRYTISQVPEKIGNNRGSFRISKSISSKSRRFTDVRKLVAATEPPKLMINTSHEYKPFNSGLPTPGFDDAGFKTPKCRVSIFIPLLFKND
jgi:hypothetical protein